MGCLQPRGVPNRSFKVSVSAVGEDEEKCEDASVFIQTGMLVLVHIIYDYSCMHPKAFI